MKVELAVDCRDRLFHLNRLPSWVIGLPVLLEATDGDEHDMMSISDCVELGFGAGYKEVVKRLPAPSLSVDDRCHS